VKLAESEVAIKHSGDMRSFKPPVRPRWRRVP
jgi:hypothetical protein